MVSTFGSGISMVFTNGESVEAIYCEGVKVWPDTTPAPGEYYVKWWPKSASGSFIMGGEARWLQDYNGYYSGPFITSYSYHDFSSYVIDRSAFEGNSEIYAVETNLPNIGDAAFRNCTSLKYFSASNARTVMSGVFQACSSLLTVYIPGCRFANNGVFWNCTNLRNVDITSCTGTSYLAFNNCRHLPAICLPNCRLLQEETFYGCYDLSYVELPVCSRMGDKVFRYCSALMTVVLGYSGVCQLGVDSSPFYDTPILNGSGSILVPLEWVSDYKDEYPYLSSHIFPIPHA